MTESLTTDLSRISGSLVIGRHTAFTFKGKALDLRKIGRELNIRYVLEGSVQRSGNRLRVEEMTVAPITPIPGTVSRRQRMSLSDSGREWRDPESRSAIPDR